MVARIIRGKDPVVKQLSRKKRMAMYTNVLIPGDDGWNPRAMMEKLLSSAKLKKKGDKLARWKRAVPAAAGYA